MIFSSYTFVMFFIVVFAAYWSLRKHHAAQNLFLLGASLLFYGWWDWRFLGLLLFCIVVSWVAGLLISRGFHRKATLVSLVTVNLGVLCVFKYLDFFRYNAVRVLNMMGFEPDWPTMDILLPVGISFFTFQSIAYVVDVYRGRVEHERNVVDFALFISFFPQLVAGPIERTNTLLPQIKSERVWRYDEAVSGMKLALWGLVKKMLVADACAGYFGRYFSVDTSPKHCVIAAIMFSVQIYCDFSGYCEIAMGTARMLGIRLMQNFRYPYFAESVQEFWRRWNISLMEWFKAYLYIPLGGSRVSPRITVRNTLIVFMLSGLWHGAGFSFIIWGLYWGVCMVLLRKRRIGICGTCVLAAISWTIFRAEGEAMLVHMLPPVIAAGACVWIGYYLIVKCIKALRRVVTIKPAAVWSVVGAAIAACVTVVAVRMGMQQFTIYAIHYIVVAFAAMVFAVEWHSRRYECGLSLMPRNALVRRTILALLVALVIVNYGEDMAFIYFQF